MRVMHDRIYIAQRVDQEKWLYRWIGIEAAYKSDKDRLMLSNDFITFQDTIRKAAVADLEVVGVIRQICRRYRLRRIKR